MKTLIVLRHAKSDWNADYQRDYDRPLNRRGRRSAAAVGRFLSDHDLEPDRVIGSSAVRVEETVRRAYEGGGWSCDVALEEHFYGCSTEGALHGIAGPSDAVSTLLFGNHQPTVSALCERLTGARVVFPTACIAVVRFEIGSWADVPHAIGHLVLHLPPRLLPQDGS